jgi:hypothetical protein
VVLRLNHHQQQSTKQAAPGIDLDSRHERSVPDRLVAWLLGLALMFSALAPACLAMADGLATHIARLDADFPEWRNHPEIDE